MGVRFSELRRVCQRPVAEGNDVAGLLFGDHLSLPLTKLLVDRGWSPSVATVGMLVAGVAGAALQLGQSAPAAVGAALLLLYYVLDCVDGEVARWRRIEHARWGYYEYIFHFVVKPLVFVCLGFALLRQTGSLAPLVAGIGAALATLWLKLFFATPAWVFTRTVLRAGAAQERPYREYLAAARAAAAPGQAHDGEAPAAPAPPFRLGFDRVTLRAALTNFDVGLALLLLAALGDLLLPPFDALGLQHLSLRGLWLLWYGLVLPLDFVDYVRTFVRRRHFDAEMVRLLAAAHGFRVEAGAPEREDDREAV